MYCPPITITFLGTGTSTGVPMIACNCEVCISNDEKDTRLRSSILIQSSTTNIVIDTTPDFRYQMLRQKVQQLDAVIFTHPHKDHIAGLDDVKAFSFFSGKPMQVYANELTQTALKREFMYVFAEKKYPGIPEIDLHTISEQAAFTIGDIPIMPILVWHLHMPVLGFRIGSFTYITDANRIDETEQQKIKGSEVMVVNALRHQHHVAHYTLDEAIALVQQLQIPQARLTHISHQLGLHQVINSQLPTGIELAYDGLQLHFG
jgi:phosphoribosyl 1,2-cyclic phosphate phosphodiesterase